MSRWLERARSQDVPNVLVVPKDGRSDSFGTTGTWHKGEEERDDPDPEFEERAAICEYDGGLPRSHAEVMAAACCAPLAPGETLEQRDNTVIHLAAYLHRQRLRHAKR